jgi:hypothetical protein
VVDRQSAQGGGFRFMPQLHDEGEKIVLGHRIKRRRRARREEVLDISRTIRDTRDSSPRNSRDDS